MNMKRHMHIRKKTILITAGVIAIAGSVGGYLYYRSQQQSGTGEDGGQTINYEPATKEDKEQADETKDRAIARAQQEREAAASSDSSKQSVKPVIVGISDLDNRISVYSQVPSIVENGGTCTAMLVKGGDQVKASSNGFANASITNCTPIHIPRDEFSSGEWKVTVEYNSPNAYGVSEPVTIKIEK